MIWVTGVTENWSAYAPGFDELDEERLNIVKGRTNLIMEDESDLERRRKDEQEGTIEIFKAEENLDEVELDEFIMFELDEEDSKDDFFIPIDYRLEFQHHTHSNNNAHDHENNSPAFATSSP
ncbi:chromatin binding protein [Puccinia graminis f. sp. tritici]|uniref:Chromatin binding protein n=1 Tax=Puccinia graminis f. sp. tritici TaxID=56615 RepID=A0A5B0P1Y6_PUCGR|nr:chromatin binding protein [Puccinia graminis f. sp. tritici]